MSNSLFSLAFGVGTQNRQGTWLEVFYAQPLLRPAGELVDAIAPLLGYQGGNQAISISTTQAAQLADALKSIDATQHALLTRLAESQRPLVVTLLAEDAALTSTPEAYLRGLPQAAPDLPSPGQAAWPEPDRHLPAAAQRRLDQPGRGGSGRTGRTPA